MNCDQWWLAIKQLKTGKGLPKAVYIHKDALIESDPELSRFIEYQASLAGLGEEVLTTPLNVPKTTV